MGIQQFGAEHAEMAQKVADRVTYGSAGGTLYFGFTANDIAMWAAAITAVLSFLLGQYWKYKHYQLAKQTAEQAKIEACATCDKLTKGEP